MTADNGLKVESDRAVVSALLELSQSRATDLHGSREDCGKDEKARHQSANATSWLLNKSVQKIAYSDICREKIGSYMSIESIVSLLNEHGFDEPAFYRFPSSPGFFVVRVLLRGLETWHATGGESVFGDEAKKLFS